jgi:DNA primase
MNATQAKQISLEDFLARLGHAPVRERDEECWYRSPLREEQEPSFRVSARFNNWVDWGTGERGDIIRLAERLFGVDTSGALREIGRVMGERAAFRATRAQPIETSIAAEQIAVGDIGSLALLGYLETRGIDHRLARAHLREIRYAVRGSPYFALAFANDAGGHEARNPRFKGTIGHKDISTRRLGEGQGVAVFEGFLDYLSAIQLNALPDEVGHAVILNSVALAERGLEKIKELTPDAAYLFLDNDDAGDRLVGLMTQRLACPLVDASLLYARHKDLNDMLLARQGRGH